jgi:hypothetical protein
MWMSGGGGAEELERILGSDLLRFEKNCVGWERMSSGGVVGDASSSLPESLRGLRCVCLCKLSAERCANHIPRQADMHMIVNFMGNAPQGFNQAMSASFAHATHVRVPNC